MKPDRNQLLMILLAALPFALAVVAVTAEPPDDKKPGAFKPAQTTHTLMEGQNKLWKEIREGILDEKFGDAALSTWILAELANVNQYQHDHPDYVKYAGAMSKECTNLARALEKKEANQARALVGKVGNICGACHNQFRKD